MNDTTEPAYDLTEANNSGLKASRPNGRKLSALPSSWCEPFDPFPQFQQGDKILRFSSPSETWGQLCGRSGMALLREGKVIDYIITRMN